ncbi:hypothetical protein [Meiothermus sp.]|uniref:hypothetical protein n=1 Tax=Meiothermus sp. TaxID=1955249 RepID=UPI002626185F|nr:hypothetical protein [Meiothermus sp.]
MDLIRASFESGGSSLADHWARENWEIPAVVFNYDNHPKDTPPANFDYCHPVSSLIMDEYVFQLFDDCLYGSGELLPLKSTGDSPYYLFNCTKVIDVLDTKRGHYNWLSGYRGKVASAAYVLAFKKLPAGLDLFRVPQLSKMLFASEEFSIRIREEGQCNKRLRSNVRCDLVWDSDDPTYWDERYPPEQWERVKKLKHST